MPRAEDRIAGFDVARAVAIAGMVIVDFEIVLFAGERGPQWLQTAVGVLDGRAAAAFVVLAGVGASLATSQARRDGDLEALGEARSRLLRRAAFLLVAGYLFVPIWPADILHHYAVFLALGTLLLAAPDRALWGWAAAAAALFAGLYGFAGYWDQFDPVGLAYRGLWSPVGLVRNLVFNGWHPVLPWIGFYLAGMWLGRRDPSDAGMRRRIAGASVAVAAAAEVTASFFEPIVFDVVTTGPSSLGVAAGGRALLAGGPLPPGPIFLLSAGGTAVFVILLCVEAGIRWPSSRPMRWAAATGQLAMTIYFGHVVLGMGTLAALGELHSQPLWYALLAGGVFMTAAVPFAVLWRRRFDRGPVEWVMRSLSG